MIHLTDARIASYRFDVSIRRSPADIWRVLVDRTDAWWMSEFRTFGEGSRVTLDAEAGGRLVERASDGRSLEWYRVQMVSPGTSLHLVGHVASDWGGPTTSMLKLEIEGRDDGGALIVSDSLVGNVTEASAGSAERGWKRLFGTGLKGLAET